MHLALGKPPGVAASIGRVNSGPRLWLREGRPTARRLARYALAALLGIGVRTAAASDCEPHPLSSCVSSNQQWLAAGPSHFAAIPSGDVLKGGALSLALAGVYQYQPLTLVAASPDPEGRALPLVEHVVDTQALFAAGLGYDFEFSSVMRLVVHQEGTGIGAARSRSGSSLATTAIRDPSFGVAYSLARAHSGSAHYALKLRTDLSLPLGDSESFASESGSVVAPAATFQLQAGRLSLVGDLGLRLRPAVTLADVRYTSQFTASTGLCVEAMRRTLFVAAEATAAPGLASAPTSPNGTRAHWVPAEWALTLSLHWSEQYVALLSGGAGLPLSSRSVDTPNGGTHSEYFAGLGAPEARVVLMLRVTSADTE